MSRFIQPLEPRTLFTAVPATTLISDELQIVRQAITTRAALSASVPLVNADNKILKADLKGLSNKAQNQALGKTLKKDESIALATLRADETLLLNPSLADARHAFVAGIQVLVHPTSAKLQAKLAVFLSALNTVTTTPLANLNTAANAVKTTLATDLSAIASADPSAALDAAKEDGDINTAVGNFVTAAQSFATDVGTLATDLATLP